MINFKNNLSDRNSINASIWYIVSNFLVRGLAFITTPIFTRFLSVSEYGDFNNFSAWISLLMILTTLDLSITISRAVLDFKEDIDSYLSTICLLGSAFTGFCYLIVVSFQDYFINLFGMQMPYINIMFIYLMVSPALSILQNKHRQLLKYKLVTFLSVISSVSSVLFSLVLVTTMTDKYFARVLGYLLPLISINLVVYVFILFKEMKFKKRYCKYALTIAVPLIPHILAGNILGTSDQIMIKYICGSSDAALYSLAYTCSLAVSVLWISMNQAMAPWVNLNLNNHEEERIKKVSRPYLAIFILIAFGIMLISPELILIFGGENYLNAKYVMPPVMAGCIFQFTYSMYVNVEIYYKKTLYISYATITAAVVNVALNYLFIPIYGYVAAAYSTLAGYAILLILHYLAVKRMNMEHVYDNRYNFFLMCVTIVFMILVLILFQFSLIRWTCIIAYILLVFYIVVRNKETVLNLIKR